MLMILFFAVMAVFVVALAFGSSGRAPRWMQKFNQAVDSWETRMSYRITSFFHRVFHNRRLRAQTSTGGAAYKLLSAPTTRTVRERLTTQVLAPSKTLAEQRMFFLFEVQFHTELGLNVGEDNILRITKKDMRRLAEYCNLYSNPVGTPQGVFANYGIRIAIIK